MSGRPPIGPGRCREGVIVRPASSPPFDVHASLLYGAPSENPDVGTTTTTNADGLFAAPSNPVGYVARLAALVIGVIHLLAAMNAIQFGRMLGILFVLDGLGFTVGLGLYLTRFWLRPLFLVAVVFAVASHYPRSLRVPGLGPRSVLRRRESQSDCVRLEGRRSRPRGL